MNKSVEKVKTYIFSEVQILKRHFTTEIAKVRPAFGQPTLGHIILE